MNKEKKLSEQTDEELQKTLKNDKWLVKLYAFGLIAVLITTFTSAIYSRYFNYTNDFTLEFATATTALLFSFLALQVTILIQTKTEIRLREAIKEALKQ